MERGGDHKHNIFAGYDPTEPVDDGKPGERPSLVSFFGDTFDLFLGHAWIVLEFDRGESSPIAAADPSKRDDCSDFHFSAREPVDFDADVEVFSLDTDDGTSHSAASRFIPSRAGAVTLPLRGLPGSHPYSIVSNRTLRPSNSRSLPTRPSPIPTISLMTSNACRDPTIPVSAPRIPACAQVGSRSSGGGSGNKHR